MKPNMDGAKVSPFLNYTKIYFVWRNEVWALKKLRFTALSIKVFILYAKSSEFVFFGTQNDCTKVVFQWKSDNSVCLCKNREKGNSKYPNHKKTGEKCTPTTLLLQFNCYLQFLDMSSGQMSSTDGLQTNHLVTQFVFSFFIEMWQYSSS